MRFNAVNAVIFNDLCMLAPAVGANVRCAGYVVEQDLSLFITLLFLKLAIWFRCESRHFVLRRYCGCDDLFFVVDPCNVPATCSPRLVEFDTMNRFVGALSCGFFRNPSGLSTIDPIGGPVCRTD